LQAGIISGDGRHLTLRGSGSDQVKQLDAWSNMNEAGLWAFRLGDVGPDGNVKEPNMVLEKRKFGKSD